MSDNPSYKQNSLPRSLGSSFEKAEHESINQLWHLIEHADSSAEIITKDEVESDLEDLRIRLDFTEDGSRVSGYISTYGRYMAAAIALIAFGFAFLMLPQSVEVAPGEMVTLALPDGSTIELNSGSVVQFNRLFGYTNRDISLNGEGFFDVKQDNTTFEVTSNGAVTKVLGTRFNIKSWSDHPENETVVAVEEGIVNFYPATNSENSVQLNSEIQSSWKPGLNSATTPVSSDLEIVTAWRERKFIFYDESLSQIFREIERRFDLNIVLDNRDAAEETLTGYYGEVSNPESLLDDICTVAGLRYSRTSNGYRIY